MLGPLFFTGLLESHRSLNCWDYKISLTWFFGFIFPNLNNFQFLLGVSNSSTRDMRIFHVLPVLSLLLGAHVFPVDSSDEASRRLNVRATISEICYPASVKGVAPGIDSQTGVPNFYFRFIMLEYVSERSAVCICHPNTGALSALISSGGLVTATNLIVLGVSGQ